MKGIIRSARYWIYYMEQTFWIMFVTVAVVLGFQLILGNVEVFSSMIQSYIPMMGSIFLIVMLMSAANYYIPQSLSFGGTRKEVFWGMEISIHGILCQMLLIAVFFGVVLSFDNFSTKNIVEYIMLYLGFCGFGNLICAISLRFGSRIGMVLYIVVIVLVSVSIGGVIVVGNLEILDLTGFQKQTYFLLTASILFDLLMQEVCYLAIKKYEVR